MESFERIYKAHYKELFCFARTMVGEEESRDVVDGAFEALWNHRDTVREDTVRAYLYRIVRNLAINQLDQQGMMQRYTDYIRQTTHDLADDSSPLERDERMQHVDQLLATMPQTTREILTACYVEGKKYREVAENRGISVATVKKHMVAALRTIRQARRA